MTVQLFGSENLIPEYTMKHPHTSSSQRDCQDPFKLMFPV